MMSKNFRKKINLSCNFVPIFFGILNILISLEFTSGYKYIYTFERNQDSEILIFAEKNEELFFDGLVSDKYEFKIFFDVDFKTTMNEKKHIFAYGKVNDMKFEVFDNFLAPNAPENKYKSGVIESDFELSYFLGITKDIVEFPEIFNNYQFKCMLTVMKCLKVTENKKIIKFFEILIFKYLIYQNNNSSGNDILNLEEISVSGFFAEIDPSIMKDFIFGFLNIFMIHSIFHNENLVLLKKIYELYEETAFDEHIPYNNLLISNLNVFFILEKVFENTYFLNMFRVLLNTINIYSLILDSDHQGEISNRNVKFHIFSNRIFKSIIILNFPNDFFSTFLVTLSRFVRKDLEYLGFIDLLTTSWDTLILFIKKQKLKGLILTNTKMPTDTYFLDILSESTKNLEYIKIIQADVSSTWWKILFENENVRKIKLYFYSLVTQQRFLKGILNSYPCRNITHFEVNFCDFYISSCFFDFLANFKSLKTLKVSRFLGNEKIELKFLEIIKDLKDLENLFICEYAISGNFCNVLFQKPGIKCLHLEGDLRKKYMKYEDFLFDFHDNYSILNELVLKYIKINHYALIEISKLKNLKILHLKSCEIDISMIPKFISFTLRNIDSLHLNFNNLDFINNTNVLNNLYFIKELDIFGSGVLPGYVSNLSMLCNSSLKKVSLAWTPLNINDLSRIKILEVLEELTIKKVKFLDCSLWDLSDECRFLISLKILNLEAVEINSEYLNYLSKFKNIEKLFFYNCNLYPDFFKIKKWLLLSSLTEIYFGEYQKNRNTHKAKLFDKSLQYYFKETNIWFLT